jgi:hypothetical protein
MAQLRKVGKVTEPYSRSFLECKRFHGDTRMASWLGNKRGLREGFVMRKANRDRMRKGQLNNALEKRVLAYTLAATASSVAVLALAQPGEAEVVYTPANQSIWANGGVLDLNNDGIVDFTFRGQGGSSHSSCARETTHETYIVPAVQGNAIRGRGSASALPSSILLGNNPQKFRIGQQALFAGSGEVRWEGCGTSRKPSYFVFGAFANTVDRYLGLQFSVDGAMYYGWARFTVIVDPMRGGQGVTATLTGYAYESNPNTPIFTGNEFGDESKENPKPGSHASEQPVIRPTSPATLGRLAQGAQGLTAWRINGVGELE